MSNVLRDFNLKIAKFIFRIYNYCVGVSIWQKISYILQRFVYVPWYYIALDYRKIVKSKISNISLCHKYTIILIISLSYW